MSFAEGLLSGIAGGMAGAGQAAADITKRDSDNAAKLDMEAQAEQMRSEVMLARQKALDEYRYQTDKERAPELRQMRAEDKKAEIEAGLTGEVEAYQKNRGGLLGMLSDKANASRDPDVAESRKEEKSRIAELRTWTSRYNTMGQNDPNFARMARAKIIELGGKDPAAQNGDYSVVKETDETGLEKVTGVFDKNTGKIAPINKPAGDLRDQAIDAVNRGASRNEVNKRLAAAGLDPI